MAGPDPTAIRAADQSFAETVGAAAINSLLANGIIAPTARAEPIELHIIYEGARPAEVTLRYQVVDTHGSCTVRRARWRDTGDFPRPSMGTSAA